ncbi:MAG: hypothetical protein J7K22_03625 [Nanoarchaeota archaeon]|nr:hypothetical protein [Nanoarchaeota archaeon]
MNREIKLFCPECGSSELARNESGELYCRKCGTVIEESML